MKHSSESSSTNPILVGKPSQSDRLPSWRLWVPLVFQTAIIFAAPAIPFYTTVTGKTVVLETVPVDPYDFLRGYSQTLSYEISRLDNLRSLPGWKEVKQAATQQSARSLPPSAIYSEYLPRGASFYVILAAPTSSKSQAPKPWKPIRVSRDRPTALAANQIALKAKSTGASFEYGLETYYMPEDQRDEINQDINQARGSRQRQAILVEIKVDAQGRAVPISVWVSDRNYRF